MNTPQTPGQTAFEAFYTEGTAVPWADCPQFFWERAAQDVLDKHSGVVVTITAEDVQNATFSSLGNLQIKKRETQSIADRLNQTLASHRSAQPTTPPVHAGESGNDPGGVEWEYLKRGDEVKDWDEQYSVESGEWTKVSGKGKVCGGFYRRPKPSIIGPQVSDAGDMKAAWNAAIQHKEETK